MTTHVFIVDATTFKLHLEYFFAGTGAKDYFIDFNDSPSSHLNHARERILVGMIADANRVRVGDNIIFYLQQNFSQGIAEGKFFGVFKTCSCGSFLDNNDNNQFLKNELGKSLTFRTLIQPYNVYAEGVTEWEALDEIKNINAPCQMLWSLIYRKLKGTRGNTAITDYEAERLEQLIRNKNQRNKLEATSNGFSFDLATQKIVRGQHDKPNYAGRQESINVLPRLISKYQAGQAMEVHLQAYITQNIGLGINQSLDASLFGDGQVEWFGNEFYCGVGMRKMDLVLSIIGGEQPTVAPVELKAGEAGKNDVAQLQRYVEWLRQYYLPNKPSDIQPILLTQKTPMDKNLHESFEKFNNVNREDCLSLRFVKFYVKGDNLVFDIVDY